MNEQYGPASQRSFQERSDQVKKNVDPHALKFLVGEACWGMIGGPGAGSMIALLIGRKIPRDRPLPNDKLSREIRENESEFSMSIFYCSWRLFSSEDIICSSAWSSNETDGPMLKGLANLLHQKIISIDLSPETLDLSVQFENGLTLSVFNDYLSTGIDDAAYWIEKRDARYSIRGFNLEVTAL